MEGGSRMRFAVELVMLVQGGKEAAGSRREVKGKERAGRRKRRRKEKRDREKNQRNVVQPGRYEAECEISSHSSIHGMGMDNSYGRA